MSERIAENVLLLPALCVIYDRGKANTSTIKNILIDVFQPSGEDNEILAGRNDTKFSQKVRNLMGSHYSTNGMAQYTSKDGNGFFTLTDKGKALVEDNLEYLSHLFHDGFSYEDKKGLASKIYKAQGKKHSLCIYREDTRIDEGRTDQKTVMVRERSRRLREAAISYYTVDGRIQCAACGFDFYKTYGELGKGYIQIHHEKPLYQYSDEGVSAYIKDAVKDTKPLCANCHCMIHHARKQILTVEELKQLIHDKTSRS